MAISEKQSNAVILQPRDIAMLRGFFEARVMMMRHVTALYFDGHGDYAQKRLLTLKSAGLIAERPRKSLFEPAVLYLTKAGLSPLRERGILREYPAFGVPALERRSNVSPRTLPHELEVMDVKIAMYAAVAAYERLSLHKFNTWPLLNQFEVRGALVKPDGFIRLRERTRDGATSEHRFFLEVDRSTEPQATLGFRASCYLEYYKSGGFAGRCGAQRSAFKEHPFRVLFVLKTEERRNNTAETLLRLNPPVLTQVWLTTIDEVTIDSLGSIWIRPLDFRAATEGTEFDVYDARQYPYHKRRSSRDRFVAERILKHALVDTGGAESTPERRE